MNREKRKNFPDFQTFQENFGESSLRGRAEEREGDSNCKRPFVEISTRCFARRDQHVSSCFPAEIHAHHSDCSECEICLYVLNKDTRISMFFPKPFPTAMSWLHRCTSKAQSARKDNFRKFCKFLAGSFSAVSKRKFARKYAFDSIFQTLQDLHPFAPLRSQNFRRKSV